VISHPERLRNPGDRLADALEALLALPNALPSTKPRVAAAVAEAAQALNLWRTVTTPVDPAELPAGVAPTLPPAMLALDPFSQALVAALAIPWRHPEIPNPDGSVVDRDILEQLTAGVASLRLEAVGLSHHDLCAVAALGAGAACTCDPIPLFEIPLLDEARRAQQAALAAAVEEQGRPGLISPPAGPLDAAVPVAPTCGRCGKELKAHTIFHSEPTAEQLEGLVEADFSGWSGLYCPPEPAP
jgi:hypothetical protein